MSKTKTKEKKKATKETPLMAQYNSIKAKYPNALLLFRVGDFYETFGEDAIKTSQILGIVLTNRANGSSRTELAGFPHHSLNTYLPKLVRAGQRVAICDQLENPKLTKKIVKRGVTELVTPGVTLSDNVLETKKNNFLSAVHFEKDKAGIAFLDISTGEFLVSEGTVQEIEKLIQTVRPSEILFQKSKYQEYTNNFNSKIYSYGMEDWFFNLNFAVEKLEGHFKVKSLKGLGLNGLDICKIAAGVVLNYLSLTQHENLDHIDSISRIEKKDYVWLDKFTVRNLELIYSQNEDAITLKDVIDDTVTPMGGRLLNKWIIFPSTNLELINYRLDKVENFKKNLDTTLLIRDKLSNVGDMERIVARLVTKKILPKEIRQLKVASNLLKEIRSAIDSLKNKKLSEISAKIVSVEDVIKTIDKYLLDDPINNVGSGKVLKNGLSKELDDYRKVAFEGKEFIDQLLAREIENTGITSLKVSFNNVFGYYIEVRNTHKDKVPDSWIRKQTLVNAERYITSELKEFESKIVAAEEKILEQETKLYNELLDKLLYLITGLQTNAKIAAEIDVLSNFSVIAKKNNYSKPIINDGLEIKVVEGRHPVIEKSLGKDQEYVSNSIELNNTTQQLMMITGPNMSGKSALLRQNALIVLMGQMGCFVPAKKAEFGYVDKVFTRVGASDNISSGESTFMVEMNETSSILHNLSSRSLILLDEIGRGTSTYDGVSIAWAIAEFIHEHPKHKAKTLFATHYHELNEMESRFDRIKNYKVSVKEVDKKILFIRKLKKGGTEHSFGIHVAKMAGMPQLVVNNANKILKRLEKTKKSETPAKKSLNQEDFQLSFIQLDDPVLEKIREDIKELDINTLTPVEALMKLNEIKSLIS